MAAQSLTCCIQPASAVSVGSIDVEARARAGRRGSRPPSRRAARSRRPCSTAPRGCLGPVMREEVGKPDGGQPEIGRRAVRTTCPSAPGRRVPTMSTAAIAPVIASKPVANTIASNSKDSSTVSIPVSVMCRIGCVAKVDEPHMGKVVGGVVVVSRHSRLAPIGWSVGHSVDAVCGSSTMERILSRKKSAKLVVGRRVAHHIGVDIERFRAVRLRPRRVRIVAGVPSADTEKVGVMVRSIGTPPGRSWPRRGRPPRPVQLGELVRRNRTVVGGDRKTRRALENDQLRASAR